MTQRIVLSFFFFLMTQRSELFFEHDSKNWTFFLEIRLKGFNLFFFLEIRLKELIFWVWLNNWTLFDYDSKNWTFGYYSQMFLNMIQRFWFFHKIQWIEPFLKQIMTQVFWRKMTQRIEPFFLRITHRIVFF